MTQEEVFIRTKKFLSEEFEIEEGKIVPEAGLKEDLELDSLDIVDVVVLVEQNFGLILVQKDFMDVKTVDDFCKMVYRKINE